MLLLTIKNSYLFELPFNRIINMKLLQNQTVIVTGASRGIGRGIGLKLAELGANVAFTYLSSEAKG